MCLLFGGNTLRILKEMDDTNIVFFHAYDGRYAVIDCMYCDGNGKEIQSLGQCKFFRERHRSTITTQGVSRHTFTSFARHLYGVPPSIWKTNSRFFKQRITVSILAFSEADVPSKFAILLLRSVPAIK